MQKHSLKMKSFTMYFTFFFLNLRPADLMLNTIQKAMAQNS